ncbi:MAG: response regulator [Candidatus Paracaedibacteraceae bacterium]|nr:response regulator [Candidatus Paracaedibacteraceae bacterium]
MVFWRSEEEKTPDNIKQEWILNGFRSCLDGFYVIQEDQFYVSERLISMLGYDMTDPNLSSQGWWESLFHADDRDRVLSYIQERREGKSNKRQIEYRLKHKQGHYLSLLVTSHIADCKPLNNFLGTVVNINSYRVLQDQLERTIEEAEKTSQTKSKFIASLNHELRTPLNGVMGMANLLMDTQLDERQLQYVETILTSTNMLLTLVNDILDVSKIASGKLEIEKVEFNLRTILSNTQHILKSLAVSKGLDFSCEVDPDVPVDLIGDQVRLQQILVNLISNAIKFTDQGYVRVSVRLSSIESDHVMLHFRVSDTGIGIPAEVIPKLFQDFTQASVSTVRTHGGTGLGLSICKKLVALMGGDIGVQSGAEKGSTFWFTLPFPTVETNARLVQSDHDLGIPQLNILIAEDNIINQQVIQGILQNLGQTVTIARNGIEALSQIEQNNFDLVFMDINMPEMDGIEATKKIRASEATKELPVVAFTADTMTMSKRDFLDMGFTDVASKPVVKQDIIDILTRCGGVKPLSHDDHGQASIPAADKTTSDLDFSAIDQGYIKSLLNQLGSESIQNLLQVYKTDADELIGMIEHEQDVQKTHNLAHTLAGMSENLGIKDVGKTARSIMLKTKQENIRPVDLISELRVNFTHSLENIDSFVAKL